jgi:hypothetical protein
MSNEAHADEVFDYIVHHLEGLGEGKDFRGNRAGNRDADLYIPDLAWNFWLPHLDRNQHQYSTSSDLEQHRFLPIYDAVWELCRIGVLRPGQFAPRGMTQTTFGDHYVVTTFGRQWLKSASERPLVDASRLNQLLHSFSSRFGAGYAQRAKEAVTTYRTANWLAACVMAGAAAESILIALAVAKSGEEERILVTYNGPSGRKRTTKLVLDGVGASLQQQLEDALFVLHYWRDSASHGVATEITEIQAHASLMQLLRLAQFADKHWNGIIC